LPAAVRWSRPTTRKSRDVGAIVANGFEVEGECVAEGRVIDVIDGTGRPADDAVALVARHDASALIIAEVVGVQVHDELVADLAEDRVGSRRAKRVRAIEVGVPVWIGEYGEDALDGGVND